MPQEKMLRDDKVRSFNIDIESETTAQVDNDKLKEQRMEFINVMSGFIQQYIPLVNAGILPVESFKAMLGFTIRPFKVGRELEESFDLIGQPQQEEEEQEDSLTAKEEVDAQQRQQEIEIEDKKVEGNLAIDAAKLEQESVEKENDREADFTVKELAAIAKQSNQGDFA
jgi:hypothetical protein